MVHKLKSLSFDFIKALTKHGSLQPESFEAAWDLPVWHVWRGWLRWLCVAHIAHVTPAHATSLGNVGNVSAAVLPRRNQAPRRKRKRIRFNHGSSFVFRSFQRGTPEALELPFQFLRMYCSIADPTVRTCG